MCKWPQRFSVSLVCILAASATQASQRLYVSDTLAGHVVVIDTSTNSVVGTPIDIPGGRPLTPVVSADGSLVYVQDVGGSISVIDAMTARVVRTIDDPNTAQPDGPASMTLSPDGSMLYAIASGEGPIAVVDTNTGAVLRRISGPGFESPSPQIRASDDGRRLYVAYGNLRVVVAFDAVTGATVGQVSVPGPGDSPLTGIEVAPDNRTVYVTPYEGSLVSIDAASMTIVSSIFLGPVAYGVDISSDGSRAFVARADGGCVDNLDLRAGDGAGTGTGLASNFCYHIAAASGSDNVYLASADIPTGDHSVVAFDTRSNVVSATIPGFAQANFDSQSIGPALVIPEPGAWWNPAEPGGAISIEVRHGTLAMIASVYDDSGAPTWLVSSGPYNAVSGTFSGTLGTYSGGPCLDCPYRAARYEPAAGGAVQLVFASATEGTLLFAGGSMPIRKYDW